MDLRRGCFAILACAMLGSCSPPAPPGPSVELATMPDVDWKAARPVTVRLSDFAFTPNHLSFEVGAPVHLTLVNVGSGAHDFSAPRFLSTVAYPPGAAMPAPDGDITLKAGQTLELDFVPRLAGTYPLECTEFLHSMFGMTGMIEVTNRQSAASRIN